MTGRVLVRHVTSLILGLVAVLLLFSSMSAWGRYEIGDVRYKFGLLGVQKITTSTPERIEHCGWYDAPPLAPYCEPAPGREGLHRIVKLAPLFAAFSVVAFVLAAFAHLRRGSQAKGIGLAPFALASAAMLCGAILVLTQNVARALAVYAGRDVEMAGSGLTAAWLAVGLLVASAALSLVPVATGIEAVET